MFCLPKTAWPPTSEVFRSMRIKTAILALVTLAASALPFATAQAQTKIGVVNIQNAIIQTKDGQKAAADLDAKFGPKRKDLEQKRTELEGLQTQYKNGVNTMSDDAKTKLAADIDKRTKSLQRDMDDFQAEAEQEQSRILNDLGGRMMVVIDKYATDRGYAVVLDVSTAQTPVLYASNTVDITRDVVELYDKGAAAQPPAAAAKPAAAAPRPAAPAKK